MHGFLKITRYVLFRMMGAGLLGLIISMPLLLKAEDEWVDVRKASPGIWKVNLGAEFPGAKARLLPTKTAGGDVADAAVEVDLRKGGQYAGLEYPLRTNATRIRFEVATEDIPGLSVRIRDNDGQFHCTSIAVNAGTRQLIDLPLDISGFPGHWCGKNDGQFRFPTNQLYVVAEGIPSKLGKFRIYNVQILTDKGQELAQEQKNSDDIWIQVADAKSREWRVNTGAEFPGARAAMKYQKAPDNAETVAVNVDLTKGGRYAGLEFPLQVTSASMIQIMLWSEDVEEISLRIIDADNQAHVSSVFPKMGEWQKFDLPLDNSGFPGHWGGKNDGVFRFPLKSILIVAENLPSKKGSFQIGSIRFAMGKGKITPDLSWDMNIDISKPGNIYFHDEVVEPEIRIANKTGESISQTFLKWEIVDQNGKSVAIGTDKANVAAYNQTIIKPVTGAIDYGYYRLTAQLIKNGKEEKSTKSYFAVVERLPNYGPERDPKSFFGLQMGDIFDPAAAARIGVKWDRPTRVWIEKGIPLNGQPSGYDRPHLAIPERTPEESKYFWPDDTAVSEGQKYGISAMMTLHYEPNGLKPLPSGSMGFPPSADQLRGWQEFVSTCVKRYDGLVAAWEIINEAENTTYIMKNVSLATGIKSYSDLISSARTAIRKSGSKHPIVAVDIASGDNPNATPFVDGVTAKVGKQIDIFTGHPYAFPRYFGPGRNPISPIQNQMVSKINSGLELMRKYGQNNKELWIGEIGWAVDQTVPIDCEYTRDFAACVAQGLIMIHSVPGVQRCFWFIQDGCNEGGFEYGLWRGNPFVGVPLQPLPAAVAYASCARFLYHVVPARSLSLSGMAGFAFKGTKRDRAVVAVWAADKDDNNEFDVDLPVAATVHDMYGRSVATNKINLTTNPVFLTAPYSDAEKLFTAVEKVRVQTRVPIRIQAAYFNRVDNLMVRMKNRLTTAEKVEVLAQGKKVVHTIPAGKTVTLEMPFASTPTKVTEVEVKLGGKTVDRITPVTDFASCPYRQPKFDGNISAWGKPQATLKSRLDILPPDLNIGWGGPEDLSADAWWGWNEDGFCFAARIHDDIFKPDDVLTPARFWMGDSLQLAFDVNNDAALNDSEFSPDDREFGFVVTPEGGKAFSNFPLPEDVSLRKCFKRVGNYTIYEVLIPWNKLGINKPQPGQVMAFNFIANDNDGNNRECWIGLRPGIGEYKRPGNYFKIRFERK